MCKKEFHLTEPRGVVIPKKYAVIDSLFRSKFCAAKSMIKLLYISEYEKKVLSNIKTRARFSNLVSVLIRF